MSKATQAFLVLTIVALAAMAKADSAQEAVDARQQIMKYIGANMRTLGAMAQERAEFNQQFVNGFGQTVAIFASALPFLFPEGSGNIAGTKAAQSIWDDRSGFLVNLQKLQSAASQIGVVDSQESFGEAFPAMAGTCSSCHQGFRN